MIAITQSMAAGERVGARYMLVAPRAVLTGHAGQDLGRGIGSSIEFMEHRGYQPGDDLRHVDWSAYARTGRLIVKRYREEVSLHLDVLIDTSRSMDLPGTPKAAAAMGLAAVLATAAANARFTCRAWTLGQRAESISDGAASPQQWRPARFDFPSTPLESLEHSDVSWRRSSVRVLISDLLWPDDPLPLLRRMAGQAAGVVIVQVLARQDAVPPDLGGVRLVDCETGATHELHVDAAIRRGYLQRLARHEERWHQACRNTGAILAKIISEDLLDQWDLTPLVAAGALRPH